MNKKLFFTVFLGFIVFSLVLFSVCQVSETTKVLNDRYKQNQSDEEICIRWSKSVMPCKEYPEYRKLYADMIKNGGCITRVADMGQMIRSWNYCKETNEPIDILFVPTGEIFNFIEEGEMGRTLGTPLTDSEYKEILREE